MEQENYKDLKSNIHPQNYKTSEHRHIYGYVHVSVSQNIKVYCNFN